MQRHYILTAIYGQVFCKWTDSGQLCHLGHKYSDRIKNSSDLLEGVTPKKGKQGRSRIGQE